jgi:cytochrome c oxidase cbb3-type subunit 3
MASAASIAVAMPARADDQAMQRSAQLYDVYCAQCHGIARNGKGVNTIALAVQPRDHSDKAAMVAIPLEQMAKAIREGGGAVNKSALMPPWGAVLSEQQITDMVTYLRQVCRCDAVQ